MAKFFSIESLSSLYCCIIFIRELPTIIPSAPAFIILRPSIGLLIPNPTAKGIWRFAVTVLVHLIESNVYFSNRFPDLGTTKEIIETVIESAADIVEIGIPFSDPMADGPIIQEAFSESLKKWNTAGRLSAINTVDKNSVFRYSYSR